jgi:signal transduction histidine kinase
MGLHNIEARVLSMKGTLSIKTDIGVGTSVYIEFEKEKLL